MVCAAMRSRPWLLAHVITSYSIHYTKLYDNISVLKDGHTFEEEYWPPKEDGIVVNYYFDTDFAEPIEFWDNTTVKLVGKVVGGAVEDAKPIGSNVNPVKNNLGKATIQLNLSYNFV